MFFKLKTPPRLIAPKTTSALLAFGLAAYLLEKEADLALLLGQVTRAESLSHRAADLRENCA